MTKVMLDLETMGVKPGYVVVSIGAVVFDETGPLEPDEGQEPEFHCRLDVAVQHAVGLRTDPSTAVWWLDQSNEARNALLEMPVLPVQPVLGAFADWLEEHAGEPEEGKETLEVEVWGNGANFDAPMLRELYDAMGVKCPWAWYNERCYRTERKTLQRICRRLGVNVKEPLRDGVHHDALDDAHYQATVYGLYHMGIEDLLSNLGAGERLR